MLGAETTEGPFAYSAEYSGRWRLPDLGPREGGDLHEGPAKRREAAGKAKKVAKTRVGSWNRPEVRRYNPAHFEGRPPGPPSPFG
jgi:hypothetical protein